MTQGHFMDIFPTTGLDVTGTDTPEDRSSYSWNSQAHHAFSAATVTFFPSALYVVAMEKALTEKGPDCGNDNCVSSASRRGKERHIVLRVNETNAHPWFQM